MSNDSQRSKYVPFRLDTDTNELLERAAAS